MKKIFLAIWLFLISFSSTFATINFEKSFSWDERINGSIENIDSFLISIANNLSEIFFIIAIIYFLIIALKLIISENSDSESQNFKKWFIWISIWFIVIQTAQVFVNSIYSVANQSIRENSWNISTLADNLLNNLVIPFTKLAEHGAAFLFIIIGIYAFYKLISSNWDDSKAKTWKIMIFHSIIWFIIIKLSWVVVRAAYWECNVWTLNSVFTQTKICNQTVNLSEATNIFTTILNWLNSFIWVWVVLMVVFAWLNIIFSRWDEEKIKKWKNSIWFIIIWIWILVMNYFILTFFLR